MMNSYTIYMGNPKNNIAWQVTPLTPKGEDFINRIQISERVAAEYTEKYRNATNDVDRRDFSWALLCELDTYDILCHEVLCNLREHFIYEKVN